MAACVRGREGEEASSREKGNRARAHLLELLEVCVDVCGDVEEGEEGELCGGLCLISPPGCRGTGGRKTAATL